MMLYKLLSRINAVEFESVVLSLMGRGELQERIEGVRVPVLHLEMKRGSLPGPRSISSLVRIAREVKPDFIQGWMYHGNLAASCVSLFLPAKPPVLWNIRHSLHDIRLERRMTRLLIKLGARCSSRVDFIINNSYTSKSQHEEVGYSRNRSGVIPNGFECAEYYPSQEARCSVRGELGLAPDTILIGHVARYHPVKDHACLIEAAEQLNKTMPNVCFVLVGRDMDPGNTEIARKIGELGLAKKVFLLGERTDIPRLTASFDIAVNSSLAESFPNAVGEAMACGVPCVVTHVGDSARIVADTGIAVPPRDPQSLCLAWKKLLSLDRKEREIMGRAARTRVMNLYSIEAVVQQYERLYRRIWSERVKIDRVGTSNLSSGSCVGRAGDSRL